MPNTNSAKKRQRQTVATTLRNKSKKSRITSAKREFDNAIHMGDSAKAKAAYTDFCSSLDKGAKAGVIATNKADRGKARAAKALKTLNA